MTELQIEPGKISFIGTGLRESSFLSDLLQDICIACAQTACTPVKASLKDVRGETGVISCDIEYKSI